MLLLPAVVAVDTKADKRESTGTKVISGVALCGRFESVEERGAPLVSDVGKGVIWPRSEMQAVSVLDKDNDLFSKRIDNFVSLHWSETLYEIAVLKRKVSLASLHKRRLSRATYLDQTFERE